MYLSNCHLTEKINQTKKKRCRMSSYIVETARARARVQDDE